MNLGLFLSCKVPVNNWTEVNYILSKKIASLEHIMLCHKVPHNGRVFLKPLSYNNIQLRLYTWQSNILSRHLYEKLKNVRLRIWNNEKAPITYKEDKKEISHDHPKHYSFFENEKECQNIPLINFEKFLTNAQRWVSKISRPAESTLMKSNLHFSIFINPNYGFYTGSGQVTYKRQDRI